MRRKKRKKNIIYLFIIIILACILTLICYEGKIFDSNKPKDNVKKQLNYNLSNPF